MNTTKKSFALGAGLLLLSGCGSGEEPAVATPPPTIAADVAQPEPVAAPATTEPDLDPIAACEALFDGGAESVTGRIPALLINVPTELDRESAQPYLVMDSELRSVAEIAPEELAQAVTELRKPFAEISAALTTGETQVAADTGDIADVITEVGESCEDAGYTLPEIGDSPYGEAITSSRGNLVKEEGQLGAIVSRTGETLVDFAITEIEVGFACTSSWAEAPANGHFVGLHLDIQTYPELVDELPGEFWISSYDFSAWNEGGIRINDPIGNGDMCLSGSDQLPHDIGPDESVQGWIVLDLPEDSGVIGYSWVGIDNGGGWEWAYGEA